MPDNVTLMAPRAGIGARLRSCGLLAAVLVTSAGATGQNPALKIVVIEGENAVNIIQQKTAVPPVVEVRDDNDLPVAGATVTFTITGGRTATFAGAQSVSVTTNAAGRAAASALSPVSSGAVRIQVQAAFQGQTATTAIAQTNVLTAAQAAQAATASGSGSAGGGGGAGGGAAGGSGGGLSGTTIGLVGAAVAGGTLVASQAGGDDSTPSGPGPVTRVFTGAYSGDMLLTFGGCTRLESLANSLSLRLTIQPDGSITGTTLSAQGSLLVVSTTCSGGPQAGTRETIGFPNSPVTGNAGALSFAVQTSNTFQDTPTSPVGTNTMAWSFTGSLAGDVIAGTLDLSRRIDVPPGPGGNGTVTFSFTLRGS